MFEVRKFGNPRGRPTVNYRDTRMNTDSLFRNDRFMLQGNYCIIRTEILFFLSEYNFSNEIEEVVHMADLERAINYVVETEISTKEKIDEIGLKTIYQMLENMVRYLPLRKPVRDFLIVLRDWPSQMEFKELSGQHYKEKVCYITPICSICFDLFCISL